MNFQLPLTYLFAEQKSSDWTLVGLARFGEIIYKAANTPAVGVNFIKRRTWNELPRTDSGNDRTRIPLRASQVLGRSYVSFWRSDGTGYHPVSKSLDSFNCRSTLTVNGVDYVYYSLPKAEANGLAGISKLPYSMKVLLENLLRNEDGRSVTKKDIENIAAWLGDKGTAENEIAYRPARVLMQDFTGVPAVVDLAAMRDAMVSLGGDPERSTRSFPSISSSTTR